MTSAGDNTSGPLRASNAAVFHMHGGDQHHQQNGHFQYYNDGQDSGSQGRKLSMLSKAAGPVVMAGHSAAQHWHVDAMPMAQPDAAAESVLSADSSATVTLKLKPGNESGHTGRWLLAPGCACRFKGSVGFASCVLQVLVKDCELNDCVCVGFWLVNSCA
jgi:hypothetical protein